jgi:caffeoyl-CoA O-methyltransferase
VVIVKTGDETNIVDVDVVDYLDDLAGSSPPPAPDMEAEARERDFPIVGPQVGRLLSLVSGMIRPGRIVELGSGFGYSAFWFGLGATRAEIHLTDYKQENIRKAKSYLDRTDHPERFVYHVGDALESVRSINGPVECVFIDMEKELYPRALSWAEERLAPGGILVADNVLWKGQVADDEVDEATEAIKTFNNRLYEAPWSGSILPIRDGVALAQKDGPLSS